jgi:hypothetical protein
MKMNVLRVVAPYSLVEVYLIMEAASTSETSVNFTRLHGARTQNTAIFIDQLSFVMEVHCVFFEVGIDFLNIIQMNFALQRVNAVFLKFFCLCA